MGTVVVKLIVSNNLYESSKFCAHLPLCARGNFAELGKT